MSDFFISDQVVYFFIVRKYRSVDCFLLVVIKLITVQNEVVELIVELLLDLFIDILNSFKYLFVE